MNYHAPFNHGYSGLDEDPKIAFAHEINFECRSKVQNMIRHHITNVFWDIAKEFDRSFIVRYPSTEPRGQPRSHEETFRHQEREEEEEEEQHQQHQHQHRHPYYYPQPPVTSPECNENLPPIPPIGVRVASTPSDNSLPDAGIPYRSPQSSPPPPPPSPKPPLPQMNEARNRPVSDQHGSSSRPRRTTAPSQEHSTRSAGYDENTEPHTTSSIIPNRVFLVKDVMELMKKVSHQMNGCQKILQSIPVGSINKSLGDTCNEISTKFSGINQLPVDKQYVFQLKVLDERLDKLFKELKETECYTRRSRGPQEDFNSRNSDSSSLESRHGSSEHRTWEQKKDLGTLKNSILRSIGKCQETLKFVPGQEIIDFRSSLNDISDLLSKITLEERYRFELELLDG
ncbi:hypothetical protein AGABI2DRAFT_118291 [Agaricus bisporus var. bisporus H97]|uniref:hypothetical protein n=1 Tax=Agaricus bisporus var. bisporus (strain H97 / ATCC MYA-4626 / FGSC 10389) TaxID=936046 RepID=UPI00029F702C|nr:hypothetical protein AGABI2DRAFT_118291 [Agaricus bisporus var. bisporus H97]EKV47743.1 hypothetical protein AGABI2DRAFT_118291 [Agaricus bisporus var. bisporus H97]